MQTVSYIQYCGADSDTHPGSDTFYRKIEPGTVMFSDTVYCWPNSYSLRSFNHDVGAGEFIGANAARVDGSADWVPVVDSADLSRGWIPIDNGAGDVRYLYPKPLGMGPTR